MAGHAVVDDAHWIEARKSLLEKEKELAKAYEAVWAQRAALPWRKIGKDYTFDRASDGQTVKLSQLFEGGKKTLILVHMMFGEDWERACPFCSFWADGYSGEYTHLSRRVNFAVVAKAAPEKLKAFAERKGWTFPFYSSQKSEFNRDFAVEFTPEEVKNETPLYNYGRPPYATQNQGLSVFHLGDDGAVYHTYSTYARGIEFVNIGCTLLDMTPEGRYNDQSFDKWVKHKEDY